MNIFPVLVNKYNNNYSKNISFKTNYRRVYDKHNKFINCNTTCFFREDLPWGNFVEIIKAIYRGVPKINFVDLGCSDGSEAVSYAITIQEKLKEFVSKIGKIKAYDVDKEIINRAKTWKLDVSNLDMNKFNSMFPNGYNQYLDIKPFNSNQELYGVAHPTDRIKKMIDFEHGNALDIIDTLPSENNILSCRNFWPYLLSSQRSELVKKIVQKLSSTNIVIIGAIDRDYGINKFLNKHGFKELAFNIFVKIDKQKFK